MPVYFTRGFADELYRPNDAEIGRWKSTVPAELSTATPPGDVIVDDVAPLPGEVIINKGGKPSAFFGTPLASYLIHDGCDTVVIVGMTTSGCVRATVLDAFQYNFHCIVPYECCADRSQISHKVTLFDLHMKYADVVTLDETITFLNGLT